MESPWGTKFSIVRREGAGSKAEFCDGRSVETWIQSGKEYTYCFPSRLQWQRSGPDDAARRSMDSN